MGLSHLLVTLIPDTLAQLRQGGITIFLVEQNDRAAPGIADRSYVLENGRIGLECPASNLFSPRCKAACLGEESRRNLRPVPGDHMRRRSVQCK
ncbi:MAG: hypothetical protein ABSH41_15530 [Syntrophobacteraceae bacterium]|jgi:branched-chain amino acid transport system ATP-binding protein